LAKDNRHRQSSSADRQPGTVTFLAYWRNVLARAVILAISGFGRPREIFIGGLVGVVILFLGRRPGTSDAVMFAKLDDYLLALQAMLTVAVVLFIGAILVTTWNLHRSKEAEVVALTGDLNSLSARLKPQLSFEFDPDCCGMWQATGRGYQEHLVRMAVTNVSGVTVKSARPYLNYLDARRMRLGLRWSDMRESGAKDINPSNQHYHISFLESDTPRRHEIDLIDPATGFNIALDVGPHVAHLSVESADTTPIEVSVVFTVKESEQRISDVIVTPRL
jgi:hypothetical protein